MLINRSPKIAEMLKWFDSKYGEAIGKSRVKCTERTKREGQEGIL